MYRRSSRSVMALTALLLLGACQTKVTEVAGGPSVGPMPPPGRVLVYGFTADPSLVQLDQGPLARRQRSRSGQSATAQRQAVAYEVQDAIAETLVAEIRKMGLPAERAGAGASPSVVAGPNDLLIAGQVAAINQGNRARRVVVGLGAGESEVRADVTVSVVRPGGAPVVVKAFEAEANSGRLPGMGASVGVGAASGTAAQAAVLGTLGETRAERKRNPVGEEGERLARRLSYNLGTFFAQQGWIGADKVPSRFSR